MDKISYVNRFVDTGSYQREKEDLSFHLFENIDFTESKRHISFFRSDFRGSRFTNVKFFRNNFNRADFISCNIRMCEYLDVDFGSCEIKNCYFENSVFSGNKYDGTTIQQSTFVNCQFKNDQFLVAMHDCHFIGCNFSECTFEQSSTEKLMFTNCQLSDSDFATMHAEGHAFISCTLKNICLGVSYVFGYLFSDTNVEDIDYLYRGEIVSYKALSNLYNRLLPESRYFEFINANVLLKQFNDISGLIANSFNSLRAVKIVQFRQTEINNILSAICFYVRQSKFPFEELIKILDFLDKFEWHEFTFEETLGYLSTIHKITQIMTVYDIITLRSKSLLNKGLAALALFFSTLFSTKSGQIFQ